MAEHDAERDESRENDRDPDAEAKAKGPEAGGAPLPLDEDAVWAAIVAGYGEEPPDPPGAKPFKSVEDLALLESGTNEAPDAPDAPGRSGGVKEKDRDEEPGEDAGPGRPAGPLGSSVVFAPGVGVGAGPRDYSVAEPGGADTGDLDEGHFVPPEPPPLPPADTTAKFAWLGMIGGPVLLVLAILLQWELTWWLTTLSIGGFLGGCATLVVRMKPDDEEDDDPGRGAVV
ncbi:hypothetical protein [Streptomyces sp. GC420]|uniref:hypothetical protein n=1 Tax=Streptomyces sp. GC420 TaxID=2697568 RepID=UPI001414F6CA|nr:hypothetical protein [Streptomyces sp. GC420]NBM14890.1 hypothetical protein [Streptomyces sp. GC420]